MEISIPNPVKATALTLLAALCLMAPATSAQAEDADAAIANVIQKAYVQGIHIDGNPEAIRSGFHPSFVMFINGDDGMGEVKIEDWISRIEAGQEKRKKEGKKKPESKVEGKVTVLDRSGHAAVAKIDVHRDGKHVFTDYMSMYRFDDGWKIVAKIFQSHK